MTLSPTAASLAKGQGVHDNDLVPTIVGSLGHGQYRFSRGPSTLKVEGPNNLLSAQERTAVIEKQIGVAQGEIKEPEFRNFLQGVVAALKQGTGASEKAASVVNSLHHAFIERGIAGLKAQIKYTFHGFLASQRFTQGNLQDQAKLADLRYPAEWYPTARELQRSIHLHVGPTNSGKTYHALQRLEQAGSGIYAGPLRLLAHEVYTRLNARGKPCNLITGDERQVVDVDAGMSSCTVEMVPLHSTVDVAVIDEIQMIGNEERGWAWTQAVMGIRAKELHLCGEERTVPLVKELAVAMGDDLQIHHYKRLSPLKTMSASLRGDLSNLRKGDCVVAFRKVAIHRLKNDIESTTRKRVAVIYGSLPPEIRAQQAALFNNPDNDYDILVASDAIGMGLNLSIKRIIFSDTRKWNGRFAATIEPSQIKQIAGRAGRYRTAAQAVETPTDQINTPDAQTTNNSPDVSPAQTLGLVTSLQKNDLSVVQRAMIGEADPIMTAGILPPDDIIVRFAAYFPPSTPFSYILIRLHNISLLNPRFHFCALADRISIANAIEPVKKLTVRERIIFCASPAGIKDNTDDSMIGIVRALAECVASNSGGGILDIEPLGLSVLQQDVARYASRSFLEKLEYLHKALILYIWLSFRFAGVFTTQAMAFYVKTLVEDKIERVLSQASLKPRGTYDRQLKPKRSTDSISVSENPNSERADDGSVSDERSRQEPWSATFEPHLNLVDRTAGSGVEQKSPAGASLDLVSNLRRLKELPKSLEPETRA
ncbi:MAG: hypothetical protein Q9182_006599 [Xanthomendoza sp. 2 TL-2023]